MHKVYDEKKFIDELIICDQCGWKGKGERTGQEHLFLTDATEVFCPNCNHYLGFISHEPDSQPDNRYSDN